MLKRIFLCVCFALAFAASVPAHAQESTVPAAAPGATTGLPFVNNGANQPVLQPLTPGAEPIDANGFPTEEIAAEGHEKKGLPQFDVSTFARQIVWLAIVFLALYFFFARKTLPTIASVLETRHARIASDLKRAEDLKSEVERVKGEYEAAINSARNEGQKLINDLQVDLKKTLEAKDADFKSRAEQAVAQLEMKINAERSRVLAELNSMAAELAVDITNRIAGVKADAATARAAIDAHNGNAKAA